MQMQNALQMQIALQSNSGVSNGLRARGAGPDLHATPTAAYPCVYVAGSEVWEKVNILKNLWRAYEGSGEALGTFGRALGVLLRALGAMLNPLGGVLGPLGGSWRALTGLLEAAGGFLEA